jgi:hypothetical protein
MFPNVRLMVVAILATIAGIGSGLGLFATFRVNHEPLARLAEGGPSLQLAVDNPARGSEARAPLDARLPVNSAAKIISVPVIVPTASPAQADQAIDADSGSIQQVVAGPGAMDQSDNTASLAVSIPAEQSEVTPEAIAPSRRQTAAAAQDQQPAVSAATPPTGEQMAAINAAAENQQPGAKSEKSAENKAAKPTVRAARPAAQVRRVSRTVRARRTVTIATQRAYQYSQPIYYSRPTYAWTDGAAQASQPVKRVQIKRHRTAKTAAAPAASSSPSSATAGLSDIQ